MQGDGQKVVHKGMVQKSGAKSCIGPAARESEAGESREWKNAPAMWRAPLFGIFDALWGAAIDGELRVNAPTTANDLSITWYEQHPLAKLALESPPFSSWRWGGGCFAAAELHEADSCPRFRGRGSAAAQRFRLH